MCVRAYLLFIIKLRCRSFSINLWNIVNNGYGSDFSQLCDKTFSNKIVFSDEILLDPDDRPLELAVNSKSPVSFHMVAGSDRNTELLRSLQSESFSPEQRRNLIEK